MANAAWMHIGATILLLGASTATLAQTRSQVTGSDLDRQTMTAFIQADVGMDTFESDTIKSKESSQSSSWTFGTFAGESRKLGVTLHSSDNEVPFTLNDSKMRTSFRDLRLHTRLGWISPSIAAALNEISISSADTDVVNIYGSSLGAGLALNIPLWNRAVINFDHVMFNTARVLEKEGRDVKLGQRQDSEISASFDITDRILDFIVGYRRRAYTLTVNDVENKELQTGAFVGFRLGMYF